MRAIVLSIGDELVLGQTVDTNSSYLSAQLARLGIPTLYHQAVADDRAAIAAAIRQAASQVELLIITGGLGPTQDDLTRQALADAMNVSLIEHEPTLRMLEVFFARRGMKMAELNKVQALHPDGTQIIPNSCGTAPGIKARLERAVIYVTPGVPREMVAMFEQSIAPELQGPTAPRRVILTAKINTFGMGESTVGQILGPLMDRHRNPKVGTTVGAGIVSVRVRSEFADITQAQDELHRTMEAVENALGPIVFSRDDQTLQEVVVGLLKEKRHTLATAESCTGGLIAKMVTDVAGCSAVYLGGWVTYSNALKTAELGVPADLLATHGAVSQPVVRAMAQGALSRSGADLAIAVTGIAGPDGGTPDKSVGTVWIGLAWSQPLAGSPAVSTDVLLMQLGGDRETIRDRAAKSALQMLRFHLLGLPLETLTWARRVKA